MAHNAYEAYHDHSAAAAGQINDAPRHVQGADLHQNYFVPGQLPVRPHPALLCVQIMLLRLKSVMLLLMYAVLVLGVCPGYGFTQIVLYHRFMSEAEQRQVQLVELYTLCSVGIFVHIPYFYVLSQGTLPPLFALTSRRLAELVLGLYVVQRRHRALRCHPAPARCSPVGRR